MCNQSCYWHLQSEGDPLPSLDLLLGLDLESQVASYGRRLGGLNELSMQWLVEHAKGVSGAQGITLKHKAAVVIVSPHDVAAAEEERSAAAIEGALSAALDTASTGGDLLVLMTLGFGLCPASAEVLGELVVGRRGWGSFVALHVQEFEGYPSAINRAMAHVPPHSITAVLTPAFQGPLPVPDQPAVNDTSGAAGGGEGVDLFLAYDARLLQSPLLLTAAPPHSNRDAADCWPGLDMPLLLFDDATYRALGPLDEVRPTTHGC